MYILLALIAACSLGTAAHFLLPRRDLRGVAVTPAIATAAAAALYTGLQWGGVAESDALLWLASIGGALVLAVAGTLDLSAARAGSDRRERDALGI